MRDLLPAPAFAEIWDQYQSVNPLLPEDFEDLQGDEDSITGAIATNMRKALHGDVGGVWWETRVKKLRGRGPRPPEHEFGADLIIELEVKDADDNLVGRKALLAQAKKGWRGADRRLLKQTQDMEDFAPGSSIVIDYGPGGCVAAVGTQVIQAGGNRRRLPPGSLRPIGDRLAGDFLECTTGRRDMYYDATRERLVLAGARGVVAPRFLPDTRVRTTVQGVPPPRRRSK